MSSEKINFLRYLQEINASITEYSEMTKAQIFTSLIQHRLNDMLRRYQWELEQDSQTLGNNDWEAVFAAIRRCRDLRKKQIAAQELLEDMPEKTIYDTEKKED